MREVMTMREPAHLQDLIATRLSRRRVLGGLGGLPFLSLAGACAHDIAPALGGAGRSVAFSSVPPTRADRVTVPAGYEARTLIAWGDPLFDTAQEPLDLNRLDRAGQELRFGTHNDMLALFPASHAFPAGRSATRQILCVNHEYFEPASAFPAAHSLREFDADRTAALFAALGVSIVAIRQDPSSRIWVVKRDARPGAGVNRRITPFTPVVFSGPATGHPWVAAAGAKFNAAESGAPAGTIPCGTLANCAGGQTPWGTYLTSEENFQFIFAASDAAAEPLVRVREDAALAADAASFGYALDRVRPALPAPAQYDLSDNPTGPALYGWVVEIDPYDPTSVPRKRTAIGRKKGENAATALTRDGRLAVYQGDDQVDEFVYKFVTAGRFDPTDRGANMDLLDRGVLHAARCDVDGTGEWIAITLEAANAAAAGAGVVKPFSDEGDLMVRVRQAARLLGATPMDRPEDVEAIIDETWVGSGTVLIPCTKNPAPRPPRPASPDREGAGEGGGAQRNFAGHLVRIEEDDGDCGAGRFRWDIFLVGGDPAASKPMGATPAGQPLNRSVTVDGAPTFRGAPIAAPDNLCFDRARNVWITTDGSDEVFGDCNDMVLVTTTAPTDAPREVRRFLVGPVGCEVSGPTFSPDERTFFASIQHPGEADLSGRAYSVERWREGARPPSSFPDGGTAWPRSAVIYVVRQDGGVIGA